MKISLLTLSGLTAALLLTGCATNSPPPAAAPAAPAPAAAAPAAAPAPAPAAAKPAAPVVRKVSITTDVYFDSGKSTLNDAAKAELDELLTRVNTLKLEVIIANGHTDNVGSAEAKEKQGLERAMAVKAYLLSKGIEANRVYTESMADTKPAAYNDSPAGRARNRRVEVELVGTRTN